MRNVLVLIGGLIAASISGADAQEVGSSRVVPIQVTGDAAARFSLVLLSDGYTATDMPKFREHVEKHLNILWSFEPFRSYRNYINVYAVEIISGESGITCDPEIREFRTTPLKMQFDGGCQDRNARGITGDREAARTYARTATEHFDQILVITNTDTYGGIGGAIATTSGGNALGPYITPHELGHSLGRLQDEYTYSTRGRAGPAYTDGEPTSIHHTTLTEAQMKAQQQKWWRWLGEPSESGGVIGRYEGGLSRTTGIWRPSKHSMMISLGYYFDQPSIERLTQRISAQVELIAAATPNNAPVPANDVIWIETAHPNFHELDVRWTIDGNAIPSADNSWNLELALFGLSGSEHRVEVKVVDPTSFVRDPLIRDSSFTATRSWTVRGRRTSPAATIAPTFTASTQTRRAVSGTEVVYVETSHAAERVFAIEWQLNGKLIPNPSNSRTFHLAKHNLPPGMHHLRATIRDANSAGMQSVEWQVDNVGPTVTYTLSSSVVASIPSAQAKAGNDPAGGEHVFVRDSFTMKLEPADNQTGHVVGEFRVNGDGWHHYYGWPDAPPGTPYLFTPRGTTIKELVYGSLSAEGLSPQPWETREPGWGTHRIEYRARDAAGNIGETREFLVTIAPTPKCTRTITGTQNRKLVVDRGVVCIEDADVRASVEIATGATLVVSGGRIQGDLVANGAAVIELVGTRINGSARIAGTTERLIVFGSQIETLELRDNNTVRPASIAGNTIRSTR